MLGTPRVLLLVSCHDRLNFFFFVFCCCLGGFVVHTCSLANKGTSSVKGLVQGANAQTVVGTERGGSGAGKHSVLLFFFCCCSYHK